MKFNIKKRYWWALFIVVTILGGPFLGLWVLLFLYMIKWLIGEW